MISIIAGHPAVLYDRGLMRLALYLHKSFYTCPPLTKKYIIKNTVASFKCKYQHELSYFVSSYLIKAEQVNDFFAILIFWSLTQLMFFIVFEKKRVLINLTVAFNFDSFQSVPSDKANSLLTADVIITLGACLFLVEH